MRGRGGCIIITSHGMVLIYLARNSDSTVRQLSDALDITERQIARLIRDMVEAGVITVARVGQRNSYSIDRSALLTHPAFASRPLGEVIDILVAAGLTIPKPEYPRVVSARVR